jgi:hypothetical protein
MESIKVKLLRPLDGKDVGETAEYPASDAKRLESRGAVEIVGGRKSAPAVENKAAPEPENKADVQRSKKGG